MTITCGAPPWAHPDRDQAAIAIAVPDGKSAVVQPGQVLIATDQLSEALAEYQIAAKDDDLTLAWLVEFPESYDEVVQVRGDRVRVRDCIEPKRVVRDLEQLLKRSSKLRKPTLFSLQVGHGPHPIRRRIETTVVLDGVSHVVSGGFRSASVRPQFGGGEPRKLAAGDVITGAIHGGVAAVITVEELPFSAASKLFFEPLLEIARAAVQSDCLLVKHAWGAD